MRKHCFSLVELFVVVVMLAVIAVIISCILVSVDKRRKARQLECLGNLKQLQSALCMYGDDNRSYLPDNNNGAGLAALLRLKYINDTSLLVCPGTKLTKADNWQALLEDGNKHCSYIYKGALYLNDLTPNTIVLQDKLGNHHKIQQAIMGDFTIKSIDD